MPFVSFRYLFDYFLFLLIQCILKEKTSIYSYSWISPSLIYHGYFFFHLWLTGCIHSLTKLKGSWVTVLIRRFYFDECSFIFIYLLEKGLLHFLIGSFTWMSSFFKRFFFFKTITADIDCFPFCVFNEDANNGIVEPRDDLYLLPLKEEKSRDMQKSYWFCLCHTWWVLFSFVPHIYAFSQPFYLLLKLAF